MSDAPLAIVLAAGLSTRMRSKTPKVLHPIAGRPLLAYVLETLRSVRARPLVVLAKESEAARDRLDGQARVVIQAPPRGTGDAVRVALAEANGDEGLAYIVYGDTPLLRAETLAGLGALVRDGATLAILAGEVGTDNAYGRIVRDARGDAARVVEARLASPAERSLPESILGAYAADRRGLAHRSLCGHARHDRGRALPRRELDARRRDAGGRRQDRPLLASTPGRVPREGRRDGELRRSEERPPTQRNEDAPLQLRG